MMSFQTDVEATSIHQTNTFTLLKNQFFYKIHAHHSMFATMMIMQILGLIFSYSSESWGTGTENLYVHMTIYSGNIIITFSLIWAFLMAFMLTRNPIKNMMNTFITTKKVNHLSNFLFLIFLSVIGGISCYLISFLFKSIIVLFQSEKTILIEQVTLFEVFIGTIATILYMLLVTAVGYLIGEMIQLHKIFIAIIPITIVGFIIIFPEEVIAPIFQFFTWETNMFIFAVKIICVVSGMFLLSTLFDKHMEVR